MSNTTDSSIPEVSEIYTTLRPFMALDCRDVGGSTPSQTAQRAPQRSNRNEHLPAPLPLLPEVRDILVGTLASNPWHGDTDRVFRPLTPPATPFTSILDVKEYTRSRGVCVERLSETRIVQLRMLHLYCNRLKDLFIRWSVYHSHYEFFNELSLSEFHGFPDMLRANYENWADWLAVALPCRDATAALILVLKRLCDHHNTHEKFFHEFWDIVRSKKSQRRRQQQQQQQNVPETAKNFLTSHPRTKEEIVQALEAWRTGVLELFELATPLMQASAPMLYERPRWLKWSTLMMKQTRQQLMERKDDGGWENDEEAEDDEVRLSVLRSMCELPASKEDVETEIEDDGADLGKGGKKQKSRKTGNRKRQKGKGKETSASTAADNQAGNGSEGILTPKWSAEMRDPLQTVMTTADAPSKQSLKRRLKKQRLLEQSQGAETHSGRVAAKEEQTAGIAIDKSEETNEANRDREDGQNIATIADEEDLPYAGTSPALLTMMAPLEGYDDDAANATSSSDSDAREEEIHTPRSPSSPISLSSSRILPQRQLQSRPRSNSFAGPFAIQRFAAIDEYDQFADHAGHELTTPHVVAAADDHNDRATQPRTLACPPRRDSDSSDSSTERERIRKSRPLIVDGSGPAALARSPSGMPMYFGMGRDGVMRYYPVIVDGSVNSPPPRRRPGERR